MAVKPDLNSVPAIEGGMPARDSFLPFSVPYIGNEEKAEVIAALESGWITTGPRTKEFEEELAKYLNASHVVALNSCTGGLHLALVAAGVGAGDEVITSPLSFVSTANVILHVGAKPVFADIRSDTYNISVDSIAAKITKRTKAIIPVHYGGQPCDMDEISELAERGSLRVIHDCATAVGAKYKGAFVGSRKRDTVVFSFYANKTMTTGEGGALATGESELAGQVKLLSLHGMSRDAWKRYSKAGNWYFEVHAPGFKYNMTDVQAALGLCQLKRLEWFISRRQEISRRYTSVLDRYDEITVPQVMPFVRSAHYIYPVLLDCDKLKITRDEFIVALREENIGTSVHYIPIHLQPYYAATFGLKRGDYPVAESVYDRLISLPLFPKMSDEDVDSVIAALTRLIVYYRT